MRKYYLLLLIFLSSFFIRASNNDSNYISVNRQFHERLFSSSKIEFDTTDLEQIKNLYASATDPVQYARIQYLNAMAKFYALIPDYEEADLLINEALNILTEKEYPADHAKLALLKGMLNRRYKYEYGQAYHWLNKALTLFTRENNTLYMAKTYFQMGVLWIELLDYDNALDCNEKAEKLYSHTDYKQNMSYMRCNSYIVYSYQGEYRKSIEMMQKEIRLNSHNKDTAYIFILNHNIGQNYYMEEKYDSALHYYRYALSIITACSKPNLDYKALSYWSLGKLYHRINRNEQALQALQKSLKYSVEANMKEKMCDIYHKQYEIFSVQKEYEKACRAIKQYEILSDTINLRSGVQEVQRMKYQMELKARQQEAEIEKQKNEIKQTILWITLLSVSLLLILCAFILFILNHHRKIQKLNNIQLTERLEKEEIKSTLQKMEHDRDIEEKKREIATTHLLVAEKSTLLAQLSETFRPHIESGKLSLKMWNEIDRFVQNNIRKDEEWEKFKIHFDKVHPEFFIKLKKSCPELTENELHLCSYIRIGIRTKEIAEMLSVTPASVATSRYRIKKKLQLGTESLDDYLRKL